MSEWIWCIDWNEEGICCNQQVQQSCHLGMIWVILGIKSAGINKLYDTLKNMISQNFRTLIGCISFMIIFCSCDPGHAVIIQNDSNLEQTVRVISDKRPYPNSKSAGFIKDSLTRFFGKDAREVLFTLDRVTGDYLFNLNPNQSMLFDFGATYLDLDQKIVLNDTDTLDFKSKDHLQVGGNFMSKQYVFTVNPKIKD
jgi:hypothetical protein